MKYITFKNDKISKLSLGTVQFGIDYGITNFSGKPLKSEVLEILNYVISNGINCFDTAQAYGDSEKLLGNFLDLDNKENIFFISKLTSTDFRDNLFNSIETSLHNLNIFSLYGLLLHDSKLLFNWKTSYTNMIKKLVELNKIKYFGISIYTSEEFELALNNEIFDIIQIPFNLFDQRAYREKWFEKAKEKNKLIFIRSIYLQGLLLMDKHKLPTKLYGVKDYLEILERYSRELKISRNQLALSYVNSIAKNAILLFGCDNISQAKENIELYNNIYEMDRFLIREISDELSNIDEKFYNPRRW